MPAIPFINADLFHFLPVRFLSDLLVNKKLHFANLSHDDGYNVLKLGDKRFSTENVGYFAFTTETQSLIEPHFWAKYADNGRGIAVGFRNSGWKQDLGAVASSDPYVARQYAAREVTALYLPVRDQNGNPLKCYRASVFYSETDEDFKADSAALSDWDLEKWLGEVSLVLKPTADRVDNEERLLILDCPDSLDVDYSKSRPWLYASCLILGFNLSLDVRNSIQKEFRSNYTVYQSSMEASTGKIVIE